LPQLDSRELLAALFNRNYFDTEDHIPNFYANGVDFVN
jgi:hypothetical protein